MIHVGYGYGSGSPRPVPARAALALLGTLFAAGGLLVTPPPAVQAQHVYVADYCTVRDVPTPYRAYADHDLTVLDWTYMVPSTYVPPDLVRAGVAGFAGASGEKLVRRIVTADLAAVRSAAASAGHTLVIQSAYRSYADQQATFNHWVRTSGYQAAILASARPGHSEHQLGTGIDFTSPGLTPWEHPDWATTPVGSWLAANAWRYGFVMSYPKGGTSKTCYKYEPWHYRWVGREAAAAHRASGLTLREYLDARLHARFVDTRWTPFEGDIDWIASVGITNGCRSSPPRFCPGAHVSREQMASFLARALELPPATGDHFTDDGASTHQADINRIAEAGITTGCASDRFCPRGLVSREQMAAFLARALNLPAPTVDFFTDDASSPFEEAINRIAAAKITLGCAPGRFCPTGTVTREQMAAFLRRALGG